MWLIWVLCNGWGRILVLIVFSLFIIKELFGVKNGFSPLLPRFCWWFFRQLFFSLLLFQPFLLFLLPSQSSLFLRLRSCLCSLFLFFKLCQSISHALQPLHEFRFSPHHRSPSIQILYSYLQLLSHFGITGHRSLSIHIIIKISHRSASVVHNLLYDTLFEFNILAH